MLQRAYLKKLLFTPAFQAWACCLELGANIHRFHKLIYEIRAIQPARVDIQMRTAWNMGLSTLNINYLHRAHSHDIFDSAPAAPSCSS